MVRSQAICPSVVIVFEKSLFLRCPITRQFAGSPYRSGNADFLVGEEGGEEKVSSFAALLEPKSVIHHPFVLVVAKIGYTIKPCTRQRAGWYNV
jgi:hypothetical protein